MNKPILSTALAGLMGVTLLSSCDAADEVATNAAPGAGGDVLARMGLDDGGGDEVVTFGAMSREGDRYVFTDVVFHEAEDAADEGDADDGDEEDDGFDELHVARMLITAPRLDSEGRVLFDAFALEEISGTAEDAAAGRLTVDRIGIEGPNAALSNDIARHLAGEGGGEFEPDWASYEFDAISMENAVAEGEDGEGSMRMRLEQFSLQDLDAVALGRMAISGFEMYGQSDEGNMMARLGEMTILGLETTAYRDMMQAMSEGDSEDDVLDAYYRSALGAPTDTFDSFALRDLAFNVSGVDFSLDEMTGTMTESGSRLSSDMRLGTVSLVPDASQPGGAQLAQGLAMLGFDQLEMTGEGHSVYDTETGRIWTEGENYFLLRDAVRIDYSQDFGGYREYLAALGEAAARTAETPDLPAGKTAPQVQEDATFEAMQALVLHSFALRIEDRSLLDRALEAGAAAQGVTKEELRLQAGAMIGMGLMAAPPEVPRALLTEVSAALQRFINEGGTLSIAIEPDEPISIGEISERAEAGTLDIEALGVEVRTEPAQ